MNDETKKNQSSEEKDSSAKLIKIRGGAIRPNGALS